MPPPFRHRSTMSVKGARPWAGVVGGVPHGVWGNAGICRGEGSRGMGVPGKGRATGGSVGVGGDGHPPAVLRIKARESLLIRAGAGVFCAGARRVRRKKGRQDQLWRGGLGKRYGNGRAAPEPGGSAATGRSGPGEAQAGEGAALGGLAALAPHGVWGAAGICRGEGSRGMSVPGKDRATGGSVGVGGDGHSPAVEGEGWGAAFNWGGRISYGEGALGEGVGKDGRRRSRREHSGPEGPARGCGYGGAAGLGLNGAEDRRDVAKGRVGLAGRSRSGSGATGGLWLGGGGSGNDLRK
jgi:hypothetical protein